MTTVAELGKLLKPRLREPTSIEKMNGIEYVEAVEKIDDKAGALALLKAEFRKGGDLRRSAEINPLVAPPTGKSPGPTPNAVRATPWLADMKAPDSASAEAIKALGNMLVRLSANGGKPTLAEMQAIQTCLDWCNAQARRATNSDSAT